MSTLNFIDLTTPHISAAWLNDVDAVVWDVFAGATTAAAARTALGITVTDTESIQDIVGAVMANGGGVTWTYNDGANTLSAAVAHSGTSGLTADDHTQYPLLLGRTTGQVLYGGTAAAATLRLEGTTHATAGNVYTLNANFGVGTDTPLRCIHAEEESPTTNAIIRVARFTSVCSDVPVVGFGSGLEFEVETAAGNKEVGAAIDTVITDATATSEDFDLLFKTMAAGAPVVERVKINSEGLGVNMAGLTQLAGVTINGTQRHLALRHSTVGAYVMVFETTADGVLHLKGNTQGFSSSQTLMTFTQSTSTQQLAVSIPGTGSSLTLQGGTSVGTGTARFASYTSVTNATVPVLTLGAIRASGTPAVGAGVGMQFVLGTDTGGNEEIGATIEAVATDVTATSEDFKLVFKTMAAGAAVTERASLGQGLVIGTATGGDQGVNTVNASSYYDDGVVLAVNPPRTWQDLTASRAVTTIYQNITGYTIDVSVTLLFGATGDCTLNVAAATPPTVVVGRANGNTWREVFTASVPNNSYYRITATDSTLSTWAELR